MKNQIAAFSASVIKVLNLSCAAGTPIYPGESNIAHMKSRHPHDYDTYHNHIAEILNHPRLELFPRIYDNMIKSRDIREYCTDIKYKRR